MGPRLRLHLGLHFFSAGRPGNEVYKTLLRLNGIKEMDARTVDHLYQLPVFSSNSLMHSYLKRGSILDARHVFEKMRNRDVVSWNIMILGYAKQDEGAQALHFYSRMCREGIQPNVRTFVGILKACSTLAALQQAKQVHEIFVENLACLEKVRAIHSRVVKSGFESGLFLETTLVDAYAKCESMEDAWRVFHKLPHRDVVSWNAMILGYAKQEQGVRALDLYAQMCQEDVQPNDRTFVSTLKACSSLILLDGCKKVTEKTICLEKGRFIHFRIVKSGFESDVFVVNALVDMYAKCGTLEDALCVFEKAPHRDVVSWNAVILGCANQEGVWALDFYTRMYQEGIHPNARTFVGALKACTSLAALEEGKQIDSEFAKTGYLEKGRAIHSDAVKNGFEVDVYVGNSLVDMYGKYDNLEDARCVFDKLLCRDVISWNAMILGYANKQEESGQALLLYAQMHQERVRPDDRTFVGSLKACINLAVLEEGQHIDRESKGRRCLEKGRVMYSQVVESGFESDVFVGSTLVDMYAKCRSMEDALRVFENLPHVNVVSWNAVILGYAKQNEGARALEFYAQMVKEGVQPNDRTFIGVLKACSTLAAPEEGKQLYLNPAIKECLEKARAINFQIVRNGFDSNLLMGNTLVDTYVKCGGLEDARCLLDVLPHRDVVTWTAMIMGYAEQEENDDAFRLFAQMKEQGVTPNNLTFLAVLKACGSRAVLETAKELHSQISRVCLTATAIVTINLIDIYAKCGSMVDAQWLFDALPARNVVPWNVLIAGYARQGESDFVFTLFDRMMQEGIWPNGVTFLGVLTVCSHVGLVEKGKKYFWAMGKQYGIIPAVEHYNCMVDLLGRAGQLDEAVLMVEKMPFQPDDVIWSTVLGACQNWKNLEVGMHAFENVVNLNENRPAAYFLMGNVWANAYK